MRDAVVLFLFSKIVAVYYVWSAFPVFITNSKSRYHVERL